LSKTFPVPSFFDVCWSLSRNGWSSALSPPKVAEEFEKLFKKCFNLTLSPLVPWDPQHLDRSLAEKMIALKDGVFLNPQSPERGKAGPPLLGREFLTWLWFKSEERGGACRLPARATWRFPSPAGWPSNPAGGNTQKASSARGSTPA